MSPVPNQRRLLWAAGGALVLLVAALAARLTLTGLVLRTLLARAGAAEIKFEVVTASPWQVLSLLHATHACVGVSHSLPPLQLPDVRQVPTMHTFASHR